ncbi:hypothetical protein QYS49_32100 [Marivirga salinae]|uniref:Uncharacterized protein n=1 Tax=Marivirga salinarum TaxID=3059078 RepID=A0AA51NB34_9BACT|nr:hypothetical protein [Marivirga sp. BDSF4-3]WMN12019.1 hypothetical protein QYS49_32100 [Marivirga sp. BDSF4-3]
MRKYLVIVYVIFVSQISLAQDYLITKNGEKIIVNSVKAKYNKVITSQPFFKGKIEYQIDEIDYYYNTYEGSFYYFIPIGEGKNTYELYKRELEGKIKYYRKVDYNSIYSPNGNINTSTEHVYLEKNGDFKKVLYRGGIPRKKKEKIANLKEFVADDKIAFNEVNSDYFQFNSDYIKSIVNSYNLRAHSFNSALAQDSTNVIFYRVKRRQYKAPLFFKIGGNEYDLVRYDSIQLNIPNGQEIKVCIKNSNDQICRLILPSNYVYNYYELSLDKFGEGSIVRMGRENAAFHLNKIKHKVSKR